jgi:pimeloyl-ACP methyl ester carboxylesterase
MPVASHLYYFANEPENYLRPPVVLLHGAGGNHLYWPPQVRRLHEQRMFAVDLSGHGKSGGIGHHAIDAYAADVIEFIKAIGLNAVVLVGHSMGGAIALHAAIRFPRQVLALGVVGSGARLRVTPALLRSTADAGTFPAAVKQITDLSFAPQTSARLKELAAQRMAEVRPSVLHGDLLACDAFDVTDQLSTVPAPTLILCGAEDRMTPPKYSEFLQTHIAGSRLEIMPNAGHMLMLEQPDAVAGSLARFLDSIPYQPGQ